MRKKCDEDAIEARPFSSVSSVTLVKRQLFCMCDSALAWLWCIRQFEHGQSSEKPTRCWAATPQMLCGKLQWMPGVTNFT